MQSALGPLSIMIFCASASENQVQGNGIFTSTLIYHHEKAYKLCYGMTRIFFLDIWNISCNKTEFFFLYHMV